MSCVDAMDVANSIESPIPMALDEVPEHVPTPPVVREESVRDDYRDAVIGFASEDDTDCYDDPMDEEPRTEPTPQCRTREPTTDSFQQFESDLFRHNDRYSLRPSRSDAIDGAVVDQDTSENYDPVAEERTRRKEIARQRKQRDRNKAHARAYAKGAAGKESDDAATEVSNIEELSAATSSMSGDATPRQRTMSVPFSNGENAQPEEPARAEVESIFVDNDGLPLEDEQEHALDHQMARLALPPGSQDGARPKIHEPYGTFETIYTRLEHPIHFNHHSKFVSPCHWCKDPRFSLYGKGACLAVDVRQWTNGRGASERYRRHSSEPSRMCKTCTTERLVMVACDHEFTSLPAPTRSFDDVLEMLDRAQLPDRARIQRRLCSLCPSLAAFTCVANCGVKLCSQCHSYLGGKPLQLVVKDWEDRGSLEFISTLRADYAFLAHDSHLIMAVTADTKKRDASTRT